MSPRPYTRHGPRNLLAVAAVPDPPSLEVIVEVVLTLEPTVVPVTLTEKVQAALHLGYRHIDTAEMYDNERAVGEGLKASGVKREDVFLTTKIWPAHFSASDLPRAAAECLARLDVSAVDLLLLHWPNPQIPLPETIGALCKVKRDGLARHIGISNFNVALIEVAVVTVPLTVPMP